MMQQFVKNAYIQYITNIQPQTNCPQILAQYIGKETLLPPPKYRQIMVKRLYNQPFCCKKVFIFSRYSEGVML